jgi:Protein of unknown function (DUF3445)
MTEIGRHFPPPYQPFVVRDDFVVRADLFPLPGVYNGHIEQNHFVLDNRFDEYLAERLAALERAVDKYRCIDETDPVALADIYGRLIAVLASEYPDFVTLDGSELKLRHLGILADLSDPHHISVSANPDAPEAGRRVATWVDAQSGIARLGDLLALSVQEDIVVMRLRSDGTHLAESLHVLLPSTWNPREKLMQGFDAIHEPVADAHRLISSASNVMKAMVTKGPYVRFGLSLSTSPRLDSHPDHRKPWENAWLDDLDLLASKVTVRMERQTTLPFADLGRALFSVRIYTTTLEQLGFDRPDLVPRLAEILRDASAAIIDYKGIAHYTPAIVEWCDRRAS